MRVVVLAAVIGLIALPAAAQVNAPQGMGVFNQYYPSSGGGGSSSLDNVPYEPGRGRASAMPQQDAAVARAARDMRERIATGMVRKGRCDDALKLAQRQGDTVLAERVTATCAALLSGKWPT